MDRLQSVEIVSAAAGRVECDILLKNASVVDVFTCTIFNASIGIYKGRFVGFGEYCAKQVIDCSGKYVCPSLLDAHSHVESSLVGPREYASAALPHGITGIAADPHEIANVAGGKGIEWMIEQSKGAPFDFLWMLPSCVPATPMETSGAKLTAVDLKPLLSCDSVYGLAEVMDFISMRSAYSDILAKIDNARDAGKKVDGHCSGLAQYDLNIYASVGVNSDHESATAEEVLQRVRRGMYAFLRDGGAAKNLLSFISAIKLNNGRHMCLCSDDKHIDELVSEGTIDHAVRLLIDNGIRAEVAICMASLNTAQRFGLDNKGAIAVGYSADFLILDDLNKFVINS
ncbi:MAG: amidohydrolase family protein, partial [Clostridia bacterium]